MRGARVWKRILHEGIKAEGHSREAVKKIETDIIKAPIIVDTRPELTVTYFDEFKHLAIPFPSFWIDGHDIKGWPCGVLVSVDRQKLNPSRAKYFPQYDASLVDATFTMLCIMAGPKRPRVFGQVIFEVDKEGNPLSASPAKTTGKEIYEAIGRIHPEGFDQFLLAMGMMACDTLMLLGCRNVGLKENEVDPKQARIAAKRHGGDPNYYRYHTLVVRPPGAKSESECEEIGMMPRHVCRGHRAYYGPKYGKGLLFGKYEGVFYIPPHYRGKRENGIIEKDYMVDELSASEVVTG